MSFIILCSYFSGDKTKTQRNLIHLIVYVTGCTKLISNDHKGTELITVRLRAENFIHMAIAYWIKDSTIDFEVVEYTVKTFYGT